MRGSTIDLVLRGAFASKFPRKRFAEHSILHSSFSDEGNAGGFSGSKAQRERFTKHLILHPSSSGKERDEETGYGYFGARYMDHELMTMWLSVDPMADKYPSMSPYNYCAWTRPTGGDEHRWIKYNIVNNPVKLVDLDGREFDPSSKIFVDDYKKAINDKLGEMYTTKEDIEQLRSALAEIAVLKKILLTTFFK